MSETPPFPVEAGDSINYIHKAGGAKQPTSYFETGYFVKWDKNGVAVIKKPAGGRVTVEPRYLRPCNDGRMVKKRGYIELAGYNTRQATKPKKRKA